MSAEFDESIARFNHGHDLFDEWLEPGEQRGTPGVADPNPHDGWRIHATGQHVGEVLVLGHDHCLVFECIAPELAVRDVARADVDDVLGNVAVLVEQQRQRGWQLGIDEKPNALRTRSQLGDPLGSPRRRDTP